MQKLVKPSLCDVIHAEGKSLKAKRIAIKEDYDRLPAKPVYNCPECYEKKCREQQSKHKS